MTVKLDLEKGLADVLQSSEQQTIESVACEIGLEFHRRGTLSSGKAASLLGMTCQEFIQLSSDLGHHPLLCFFTPEEWAKERASRREREAQRRWL